MSGIVKKEEFIDPAKYPEEQRPLVEEFNRKLKNSMGIVTALGKEYHTIWIVDCNDYTMELYRSTGENAVSGLVDMGLDYGKYDKFIEAYIDIYVVDGSETVFKDVQPGTVLERIKSGALYTVDYLRMNDDGNISYHQMAFALAGDPETADRFILAFRDVDRVIRKHMSDKLYLREQLNIVNALSRDYYNVFKLDLKTGGVVILKLDGYVTKGMDKPSEKVYSYEVLYKQYVQDRVYKDDIPVMMKAMSLETIRKKMTRLDEYVASYRVMDNEEIHYYQFSYIPINPNNSDSAILAAFKNVDDVVETAKERDELISLAETDIMTGILNRGSGEKKVSYAFARGKRGMFCVIDIDSFKSINDSYGHDIGDRVIRGIADILKDEFRERDLLFRLGGDEYAVFAVNVMNRERGESIINRILDRVGAMEVSESEKIPVSISVGAVILSYNEEVDFEEAYRRADKLVYKSKETKGNAVTFEIADQE